MDNLTVRDLNKPAADDWDSHWDDYSAAASENPAQAYRRRLALKLLGRDGTPQRLVDIGSGQGDFLRAAAQQWPEAELLGIEMSGAGIAVARKKVPKAGFVLSDLTQTTAQQSATEYSGWGTHALCSEVLEHLDDPVTLLANSLTYLQPGALVVITVPGGRMSAFDHHIGHRRHYTPASLAETMRAAGLTVDWTGGAGFPFFNLYRAIVIARGDRLVADVSASESGRPQSSVARMVMAAFNPLFRMNLTNSRWGIQIAGLGSAPG